MIFRFLLCVNDLIPAQKNKLQPQENSERSCKRHPGKYEFVRVEKRRISMPENDTLDNTPIDEFALLRLLGYH